MIKYNIVIHSTEGYGSLCLYHRIQANSKDEVTIMLREVADCYLCLPELMMFEPFSIN